MPYHNSLSKVKSMIRITHVLLGLTIFDLFLYMSIVCWAVLLCWHYIHPVQSHHILRNVLFYFSISSATLLLQCTVPEPDSSYMNNKSFHDHSNQVKQVPRTCVKPSITSIIPYYAIPNSCWRVVLWTKIQPLSIFCFLFLPSLVILWWLKSQPLPTYFHLLFLHDLLHNLLL